MVDTRSGVWPVASIVIAAVLATAAVIAFAPDDELTYPGRERGPSTVW